MLDNKTKVIAVCVAGIDEEYNSIFLERFRELAKQYHFKVLYFYSFNSLYAMTSHEIGESNIFQLINFDIIDGMIILSQTIESFPIIESLIKKAEAQDIPTISVDYSFDYCYNICFDYDKALRELITHLIVNHGAKTLNFIGGVKENIYSQSRERIFREVMAEQNLEIDERRMSYGDFWSYPTRQVMDKFFESGMSMPDAIVCANDTMAITVIGSLKEAGYRVPEDVMVTGFDGIREAMNHYPSITTAHRDIEKAADLAFQLLDDIFHGKTPDHDNMIDSKVEYGGSCGCVVQKQSFHNSLTRTLYEYIEHAKSFSQLQINMTADLTDKDSFHEVFESIKNYISDFDNNQFWLCIVDNFLTEEEELSDLLDQSTHVHTGYSNKMDLMLYRVDNEWQGIMDFATKDLLPNLSESLKTVDNVVFFPMHVHEQTIGYAALSYDTESLNLIHCYQFFMNVSNALEVTKSHLRQQMIIASLENKYVHDPMTGLFNRRGFYQRVESVYRKCIDNKEHFMLLSVDLNGLKLINDTYGHGDGDIAISTVAKALMVCAKQNETCARFGGDEFVVAGKVNSEEDGDDYLQRIRKYLDNFNNSSGKPYKVSASIGIVLAVPTDAVTLDQFISRADEKMYSEKAKHHLSRSRQ